MHNPTRTAIVALVTLAGLATGCGAEDGSSATPRESASSAGARPSASASARATDEVPCKELIESKWVGAEGDPDLSWEPDTGRAEFTFGSAGPVTVNMYDPDCLEVPDIGALVASALAGHEVNRATECENAVRQILEKGPPVKIHPETGAELVGDLDAVRDLVVEWCPPAYEKRLRDAGR